MIKAIEEKLSKWKHVLEGLRPDHDIIDELTNLAYDCEPTQRVLGNVTVAEILHVMHEYLVVKDALFDMRNHVSNLVEEAQDMESIRFAEVLESADVARVRLKEDFPELRRTAIKLAGDRYTAVVLGPQLRAEIASLQERIQSLSDDVKK